MCHAEFLEADGIKSKYYIKPEWNSHKDEGTQPIPVLEGTGTLPHL